MSRPVKRQDVPLTLIKTAHTMVWAFFAGCIVAMPLASWRGKHRAAGLLAASVFVEVMILALNQRRCPLTSMAAKYTDDRSDNFDIYLPAWLARHNQLIFGGLYFAGLIFSGTQWVHAGCFQRACQSEKSNQHRMMPELKI